MPGLLSTVSQFTFVYPKNTRSGLRGTTKAVRFRPSLVIKPFLKTVSNPKMKGIFGSQDQTARSGSTQTPNFEFYRLFSDRVVTKQLTTAMAWLRDRTTVRRTRVSQRTQMKLCRWGEENTACALQARRVVFPPARIDLVPSTSTACRRRPSSSSTTRNVCFSFSECPSRDCRRVARARAVTVRPHRLRADARGVREWVAGHSSSSTGT